jgi:hypothetical protein
MPILNLPADPNHLLVVPDSKTLEQVTLEMLPEASPGSEPGYLLYIRHLEHGS